VNATQKRLLIFLLGFFIFVIAMAVRPLPVVAQVVYNTPTPRPDGRIIYIVKPDDTCIRISLLHKISESQLRQLNNIRGTGCVIQVGQELLIGYNGPAESPTPGPSQTPTPLLPTPTPLPGEGKVCILLFKDVNGNGIFDDAEYAMPGGEVSLVGKDGTFSKTGATHEDPVNPLCFEEVKEGEYTVSIAVPQDYNPTTFTSRTFKLRAGDTSILDFGAQISRKNVLEPIQPVEQTQIPIFGILGVVLILGGIGLGIYLRRWLKQ
jgi:hypothetical protein